MKINFLRVALTTAIVFLATSLGTSLLAQPNSGGPTPGPTVDPTGVPIDGGASLLLAAGLGLGLKRLRQYRIARK